MAQGKLAEAARAYGEGLAIRKSGSPAIRATRNGTAISRSPTPDSATWRWRRGSSRRRRGLTATGSRFGSSWPLAIRATHDGNAISRSPTASSLTWRWRKGSCGGGAGLRDVLAIAKRLAAGDPSNTGWQRDLAVSYSKLADVAVAQGKLAEAARAYDDVLAIAKRLAAGDPTTQIATRSRVLLQQARRRGGGARGARGGRAGLRRGHGDSEATGRRRSSNTAWQRDLSVSHNKLGDVAVAQGSLRRRRGPTTTGSRLRRSWSPAIRATRDGNAICRFPTTGSVTWRRRKGSSRRPRRPTGPARDCDAPGRGRSEQHAMAKRSRVLYTNLGDVAWRKRTRGGRGLRRRASDSEAAGRRRSEQHGVATRSLCFLRQPR